MQLAAGLVRVVHAGDAECTSRTAASGSSRSARATATQVLAADEEGDLAAVDDDLLDRLGVGGGAADEAALEGVGEVVEVAAVRPRRTRRAAATGRRRPP